jgi:protein-tyrosine phosphatase
MILDCSEIIPDKLWVGGYLHAEDAPLLRKLEITSVLSLQSDRDLATYDINFKKLLKAFTLVDIELRRIPIPDFDKRILSSQLPQAVEELEKVLTPRWVRAYIHCSAGINRSPTLAAAYLIKTKGMSADEACDYLVARRDCNPYLDVLKEYEASIG